VSPELGQTVSSNPLPAPSGGAVVPAPAGSPNPAPRALHALEAPGDFVSMEVPGFRPAIVAVPRGATARRPVIVALHGNFDRPEWQCEVWRDITGGHPFILCPRGIPRDDAPKALDRWTYGALKKTEEELFAGLDALAKRFPEHADGARVVYTGFSLGAILGARTLQKHAERFPRAVLTEGGYESWSAGAARAYAKGGGERVLFACGQTACRHSGDRAKKTLEKENVKAVVAFGGNIGHTYDGKVADAISEQWQWLVDGDERWQKE
jgi:predicted esterase